MDDKTKAAGIILVASSTGRILLSLRPCWMEPNLGENWSGWGGLSKVGEYSLDTALRELWEETKYDGPITLFKTYKDHLPDKNFEYQNYIGVIPEEFTPELDLENDGFRWMTMSELYSQQKPFKLNPGFERCLNETKAMLLEIIKGLGILNEILLRDTVTELILGAHIAHREIAR